MRHVCLNRTHTLNCQHNVTLTSQVERWSSVSLSLFFFFLSFSSACYLVMKVRWWQRNAPRINLSAFSTMTAQFSVPPRTISRLSVYVSRSRCRVCLHLPDPIWMWCLRSVMEKRRERRRERMCWRATNFGFLDLSLKLKCSDAVGDDGCDNLSLCCRPLFVMALSAMLFT